ncbi:hypothetical protein HQQ81_06495 [Microbacteriaceae bacterium VKM Ac-2854]|nr:hypothetical protein [Microbacteriaceae bacterium VKM Ac-2854]
MSYTTTTASPRRVEPVPEAPAKQSRFERSLRGVGRRVDPRLVVGLILVAASVIGTVGVVTASDRTVAVYAMRADLGRGQSVSADDLEVSEVALGALAGGYLRVGALPTGPLVLTRAVRAGELVPTSAVEPMTATTTASVVLQVAGPIADGVVPGAFVQIWALASSPTAEAGATVLAGEAEVRRLLESDGLLSSNGDAAVEVILNRDAVPGVLQAQGRGDGFALVALDEALEDAPATPEPTP